MEGQPAGGQGSAEMRPNLSRRRTMSSSSLASSSPSSSAVTIPIPGKSILKKPPPPQQGLLSRFARFLPQGSGSSGSGNNSGTVDEGKPLKRAHFILPEIAVVYPISNLNPPSTPTLKDEKRAIEEREYERRRRVVKSAEDINAWWTLDKVESFYRECCAGCDERPDPAITAAFHNARPTDPISIDFSGVQLTTVSAGILADVFTIEWGLRKLIFKECDLDEHTLKPILHALLIPNSLVFLSLASNKKIKLPSFRIISAFIHRSSSLQFLDLSQIPLDKKATEVLVAALTSAGHPGLASLRLDDCALKPGALEALAKVVRTSSLKNISLRYNKINQTGAIALSVMIRDYPDAVPMGVGGLVSSTGSSSSSGSMSGSYASTPTLVPSSPRGGGSPNSSLTTSPASSVTSLPLTGSSASAPAASAANAHSPLLPNSPSTSHPHPSQSALPPPRHPATHPHPPPPSHSSLAQTQQASPAQPMTTTYTPYVPRSRRTAAPAPLNPSSHSAPVYSSSSRHGQQQPGTPTTPTQNVPIITTNSQGGVTTLSPASTTSTTANGRFGSGSGAGAGLSSFQKKLNASLSGMGISIGSNSSSSSHNNSISGRSTSSALNSPVSAASSPIHTTNSHTYPYSPVSSSKPPHSAGSTATTMTMTGAKQAQAQAQTHQQQHQMHQKNQPSLPSLALLDKVRALDALPRLGSLRTLDLRGNDLRHGGVGYLGQVLKRNRTLKVLNLSENKIDPAGLAVIAEGLKYNRCLETLDLSRNPLGGGGTGSGAGGGASGNMSAGGGGQGKEMEGIHALRISFTLNTSLKRLFLSSCSINSAGAICLAEFLPESRSLLHLDLTGNTLGVAGVMALAQGLKSNKVMRCLDLEVPPGDEGYARLCREILNTCIRNTEEAERVAQEAQAAAEAAEVAELEEAHAAGLGLDSTPISTPATSTPQTGTPPSVTSPLPPTTSNSGTTVIQELSKKASLSSISTTASHASGSQASKNSSSTSGKSSSSATPTKKAKSKALWGMIEDSELAKAIGLQDALAEAMRSRSPSSHSQSTGVGGEEDVLGLGLGEKDKEVVGRARRGIRLMKEVVEKGGFEGVVGSATTTTDSGNAASTTTEPDLFSSSPFSPTAGPGSSSAPASLSWAYGASSTFTSRPPTPVPATPEELVKTVKGVMEEMTELIGKVVEGAANATEGAEGKGVKVEELLDINDEMMGLLGKVEGLMVLEREKREKEREAKEKPEDGPTSPGTGSSDSESAQKEKSRPSLKLKGLGIRLDSSTKDASTNKEKTEEEKEKEEKLLQVVGNGYLHPHFRQTSSSSTSSSSSSSYGTPSLEANDDSDDEFPLPSKSRKDKGKERAPPEPIRHEPVLSPTSVLMASAVQQDTDDDEENEESSRFPRYWGDEDGEGEVEGEGYEEEDPGSEQNERSKIWVQEEGEVFRKGNLLLGPDEMEGEYAGEDLRRELLEASVERPAPRALDELGNDILTAEPIPDIFAPSPTAEPLTSPRLPPSSPQSITPVGTPSTEKPPPRPYVPRTRSASNSSSIMSLVSPTPETGSPTIGTPLTPVLEGEAGLTSSPTTAGPVTPKPYISRKMSTSSLDSQKH